MARPSGECWFRCTIAENIKGINDGVVREAQLRLTCGAQVQKCRSSTSASTTATATALYCIFVQWLSCHVSRSRRHAFSRQSAGTVSNSRCGIGACGGDCRPRKLERTRAIFRCRESERRWRRAGATLARVVRLPAFPHGARWLCSFRFGTDRLNRLRSKLVVSLSHPVDFGVTTGCGTLHHAMTIPKGEVAPCAIQRRSWRTTAST